MAKTAYVSILRVRNATFHVELGLIQESCPPILRVVRDMGENIVEHLEWMWPHVYSERFQSDIRDRFPDLVKLGDKADENPRPYYATQQLTSSDGTEFTLFGKDNNYGDDLYDTLIGPHYKGKYGTSNILLLGGAHYNVIFPNIDDLRVQTWRRGSGVVNPSECQLPHLTENIEKINFMGLR